MEGKNNILRKIAIHPKISYKHCFRGNKLKTANSDFDNNNFPPSDSAGSHDWGRWNFIVVRSSFTLSSPRKELEVGTGL